MKRGICVAADQIIPSAKWYAHHDTIGCADTLSGNIDFFSQYTATIFVMYKLI